LAELGRICNPTERSKASLQLETILYNRQTEEAKAQHKSNCPDCVLEGKANKEKIWDFKDMEADNIRAWSKGGPTNLDNGQMLCKRHNRLKGNK